MSLRERAEAQEPEAPRRYMPYLTWLLLAMLFAYLLTWYYFGRTSSPTEQRMISILTAMRYIEQNYVDPVDENTLYQGAMRGMIASLDNKYSYYLDPAQWKRLNEETEGEYVGIGVRIRPADGWAVVAEVFANGPAAKAGLKVGDVIAKVQGQDAHGMSTDDLVHRIQGKPGTEVALQVRRPPGTDLMPFAVQRARIEVPSVRARMLAQGIGLLSIEAFDKNVAQETQAALVKLRQSGLRGLLLDLRGNPGGLMDQSIAICDMFLDKGLILRLDARPGLKTPPPAYADSSTVIDPSVPIAVLVDKGTASAAEILSGCLQATHRAIVIGTGTFGKGSVTNLLPLKDDSGIVLTVYHYVLEGGEKIEGKGVKPDILVGELPPYPMNDETKAEAWRLQARKAAAEQEDRALQYLRGKLGIPEPAAEPEHAADAH